MRRPYPEIEPTPGVSMMVIDRSRDDGQRTTIRSMSSGVRPPRSSAMPAGPRLTAISTGGPSRGSNVA